MFRNYLKIAWRNLARHKLISFVNLFGLTVGLTCCLIIAAYIIRELSYDRYHKNAENIYRLTRTFYTSEGARSLELSAVAPPFGHFFPSEFPEVEKITRLLPLGNTPMAVAENKFNESGIYVADPQLFDLFDVDIVKGNATSALSEPNSIMLSEEAARRYFGSEDPMGKILRSNNTLDVKVTGVYQEFPENSHLRPEMLLSFSTLDNPDVYGSENLRTNWGNNAFLTYLLFPSGYDVQKTIARFPAFLDKHMADQYGGATPSKLTTLQLQPLTSIHLHSKLDDEGGSNGDITRVYIFAAVALFILLIACINYMNLATARASLRAREIGIRKAIGAQKKTLIFQFLGESVLTCCMAVLLAVGLSLAILPWVNNMTDQSLTLDFLFTYRSLGILILTPLCLGLLSGLYPAIFLSSFSPTRTLKGIFATPNQRYSLRQVLVVFQFGVSIVLLIATMVVFRQLHFLQSQSLGYDRSQLVVFNMSTEMREQFHSFEQALSASASIEGMTRSSRIPTGRLLDNQGASTRNADSLVPTNVDIKYVRTDPEFSTTYGLQMASGRYYSKDRPLDSANYVVNEAAVRALGWSPEEAIGQDFVYGGQTGKIIGVVKDFYFESLHQRISPIVFLYSGPSRTGYNRLSVRLAAGRSTAAIGELQSAWKQYFPNTPFDYSFLDTNYARLYRAETLQGRLFSFFAAVAIVIACLGLFGLSAFAISQRIREIGVRKVLGASVSNIVMLVSTSFLKLVLIAAVIAFPLAWWMMSGWLHHFAYRVDMAWWIFLIAAALSVAVALGTIAYLAIKAALTNPVKNLRTE